MSSNPSNEYMEVFKKAFTEFSISKIIDKYKEIFLTYKTFWPKTKAEASSIKSIYQNYLIVLSLIGPLGTFVAQVRRVPEGADLPLSSYLLKLIVSYFIYLGYFYCFTLILEKLVPTFNGSCTKEDGFKLISYSMFPLMLGGIFVMLNIFFPMLILLAASIYLLWLGVPVMLNVPEEKKMQAFVTVTAVAVMLMIILSSLF